MKRVALLNTTSETSPLLYLWIRVHICNAQSRRWRGGRLARSGRWKQSL